MSDRCRHGEPKKYARPCPLCLPRVLIDFETRSTKKLGKGKETCGTHRYAEDPSTQILSLSYTLPAQKTKGWRPFKGEPFPQDLIDCVNNGFMFEAHNAAFEREIWRNLLVPKGIPMPTRWCDTMATAGYYALPMGLAELGNVLNLPVQKDPRGKAILKRMSEPRKPKIADYKAWAELHDCPLVKPKKEELIAWCAINAKMPLLWNEDEDDFQILYEYNDTDCDAELVVSETLGDLPLPEYRTWVFDQRINQRGVMMDREAVESAIAIVEELMEKGCAELKRITGGAVETPSQRDKILTWCKENGLDLDNLRKETVAEVSAEYEDADDLEDIDEEYDLLGVPVATDSHVKRVLEIRSTLGLSSIKKLYALLNWACKDDRIRGMLQYYGASTGRFAGRGPQPQNLPRGIEKLMKAWDIEALIDLIKTRDPDFIESMTGYNPILVISTALRGMFIAGPGKKLAVADFSAIEGVVTAWLAGEEWKIKAFEGIFAGEGYEGAEDIYCATAQKLLGRPVNKKDHPADRQTWGKVPELAFGYMGGVGAWRNFDKTKPHDTKFVPDEKVEEIKNTWRDEHPMTKKMWWELERAAINAVKHPGRRYSYRYISFETVHNKAGDWLTMILPNGRRLWYYRPWVDEGMMPWGKMKEQLHCWGKDSKHQGRWMAITLSPGILTENAVQAISRDIMIEAMIRVEKAGYPVILTVHDEVVTEPDENFGSLEEFEDLMLIPPVWLVGCPIGVAGWIGNRYKK